MKLNPEYGIPQVIIDIIESMDTHDQLGVLKQAMETGDRDARLLGISEVHFDCFRVALCDAILSVGGQVERELLEALNANADAVGSGTWEEFRAMCLRDNGVVSMMASKTIH